MARVFAWLRPNDLVWLFVANNWVMGNRPPAFDILYWNSDTTRLPAEFHADLLRMFMDNPLKDAGKITVLGTPIDMSKVDVPAYVVAGVTDHITPWQACYQSRNILRGKIDFVLSSSGHIQSIVNPPTNPKAKYFLNDALPDDPEDLDRRRERARGQLVGSLESLVPATRRRSKCPRPRHRATKDIPPVIPRRGATSTRDEQAPGRIRRSRRRQSARRHPAWKGWPAAAAVQRHRRESRAVLPVHGSAARARNRDLRRARSRHVGDELAAAALLRASRASPTSCSTASATSRWM